MWVRWPLAMDLGWLVVLIGLQVPASTAEEKHALNERGSNHCTDPKTGLAQRCTPEFINAAFQNGVEVTNTCGVHERQEFCVQTGASGASKSCDICDNNDPRFAHPASYLTDFNTANNATWWQSENMAEEIQWPNSVNLTLRFGKTFEVTYVRLKFISPRPESFALWKKTHDTEEWTAWQYYSGTCRRTYKVPNKAPILPNQEAVAQCTDEYSNISPLSGADVAFSTLEGRPSAENFVESDVLQEWVTASAIKVTLDRLNTFGDEIFKDNKVLRSYYYAISDLAVGARCKCNGHARECVESTGVGVSQLVCRCEHNTQGQDCQECQAFYNDRPWKPATAKDANECKACSCNNLSNRCYFDEDMYGSTGSGGHCVDCRGYTTGPHCEHCLENHHRQTGRPDCTPCNCNDVGSLTLQCGDDGQCPCKPGVASRYCDRCDANFYEFSPQGCKTCGCSEAGSLGNSPRCNPHSGSCQCKINVEGRTCDRCKPGHFNLDMSNDYGCLACFCYGHSSVCKSAPGYFLSAIQSEFTKDSDGWKGMGYGDVPVDVQHNEEQKTIALSEYHGPTYFSAPAKFLGDQRSSYNQILSFKLRVNSQGARASIRDIEIKGAGRTIASTIMAQENGSPPTTFDKEYKFRLHEDPMLGWNPRLTAVEFISVLSNLTALLIRGTYTTDGWGFLSDVRLESASQTPSVLPAAPANWVESCDCPEGHVGMFCEECSPGYRREMKNGGPFSRCVKCECHGHTDLCEAETGKCICEHNTAGDQCERCERGYYGNALDGTPQDCAACPCPDNGPCILHTDDDIICLECPIGYSGRRCDLCADGYYGNPLDGQPCKPCDCNGNIDPNNIGNCDQDTGECKKCIFHTVGTHCDRCLPGYFGDALRDPKGDCQECRCYPVGTQPTDDEGAVLECEQKDGQCPCLPHVTGQHCDRCETGFFNITSGAGCQSCNCDAAGSANGTCDVATGQCRCKDGVTGRRCDQCRAYHFGFGYQGCERCECLQRGSLDLQCDVGAGQCKCRPNIEGRKCDRCIENMYNLDAGCIECPPCYGLVKSLVDEHRANVSKLGDLIEGIKNNPQVVNDTNFDRRLAEVAELVDALVTDVGDGLPDDSETAAKLNDLRNILNETSVALEKVEETLDSSVESEGKIREALDKWDLIRTSANEALKAAQDLLESRGRQAWTEAEEASQRFGAQSERLSALAKEAREAAKKQSEYAEMIDANTREALNTSTQALEGARKVVDGGRESSDRIVKLENSLATAEDVFNRTRDMSNSLLSEADSTYADAAKMLQDVNELKQPAVDVAGLKKEAELVKTSANDSMVQSKKVDNENIAVIEEAERTADAAEQELDLADQQQDIADRLMADLDASRAKATAALELAEKTLQDANQTLLTLQGFDAQVAKSQDDAELAWTTIPEIERLLADAKEKTDSAQSALGNAANDADNAEKMAKEAQDTATEASASAKSILAEAEVTSMQAVKLEEEAQTIGESIDKQNQTLTNYGDNLVRHKEKAGEALTKAGEAETLAQKAKKIANEALDRLNKVVDLLTNLDEVKSGDLSSLDAELKEAEAQLEKARLADEVASLQQKQASQRVTLSDYLMDIERLEKEVTNMEQIVTALPDRCFNVVKIEEPKR